MVKEKVPVFVVPLVVTVMVDEPEPTTDGGLKLTVAPAGRPLALKTIVPLKPFKAESVTVYVVLPPCTTVREDGEAEIVKSGVGVALTVNTSAAICPISPWVDAE